MIPLDDRRWFELDHAYGRASDIPAMLLELSLRAGSSSIDDGELWHNLWSSLCHQDNAYTASYAAVPHIVEIALHRSGPIRFDYLLLPTAIEVARFDGYGPEVPADLKASYDDAITKLADCVALHQNEDWDEAMLLSALAALAVAKRHHEVAKALLILDSETIAKINAREFLEV